MTGGSNLKLQLWPIEREEWGREKETVSSGGFTGGEWLDRVSSGWTGGSGARNNKNGTGPLGEQSQDISFQPEKTLNPDFSTFCMFVFLKMPLLKKKILHTHPLFFK